MVFEGFEGASLSFVEIHGNPPGPPLPWLLTQLGPGPGVMSGAGSLRVLLQPGMTALALVRLGPGLCDTLAVLCDL